jgi:hypothetical protein
MRSAIGIHTSKFSTVKNLSLRDLVLSLRFSQNLVHLLKQCLYFNLTSSYTDTWRFYHWAKGCTAALLISLFTQGLSYIAGMIHLVGVTDREG